MITFFCGTLFLLWPSYRLVLASNARSMCEIASKTILVFLSLVHFCIITCGWLTLKSLHLVAYAALICALVELFLYFRKRPLAQEYKCITVPIRGRVERTAEIAIISFSTLWLIAFILLGLFLPVRSDDEIEYHMAFPQSCYQNSQFSLHIFGASPAGKQTAIATRPALDYPKSFECIVLWHMALSHSDRFNEIVNFWFFLSAVLAFYSFLVWCGIRPIIALIGLVFLITLPMILMHLISSYVDLALASCLLLSICFLVRALSGENEKDWTFWALSTAWLPALKFTGAEFFILLVLIAAIGLLLQRSSTNRWILVFSRLLLFALAIPSIWYVANLIFHGNPLGPYKVELFGITLFQGMDAVPVGLPQVSSRQLSSPWAALWNTLLEKVTDVDLGSGDAGFGAAFLAVGFSSILISPLLLRRQLTLRRNSLYFAMGLMFLILCFQPYRWIPRFILLSGFWAAMSFCIILQFFRSYSKILPICILCWSIYYTIYFWLPYLPHRFFLPEEWVYLYRTGDLTSWRHLQHPWNYSWANAAYQYARTKKEKVNALILSPVRLPQTHNLQFAFFSPVSEDIEQVRNQITCQRIDLVIIGRNSADKAVQEIRAQLLEKDKSFRNVWRQPLAQEFFFWTQPPQWIELYEVSHE